MLYVCICVYMYVCMYAYTYTCILSVVEYGCAMIYVMQRGCCCFVHTHNGCYHETQHVQYIRNKIYPNDTSHSLT